MSFMKGQAVTYIDHEGHQQGALVLVPDNPNHEATIALVKPNALDAILNSADFHDGLERKFNIDSTQGRIQKLSELRQKTADETGSEQPALAYSDLTETIYASPYTLPTGSFQPAPKVEKESEEQAAARINQEKKDALAADEKAKADADAKAKEEEAAKAAAAGSGAGLGSDDQGQKPE